MNMSRQNKSILKPYKRLTAFFCWFFIGFLSPCMADTIIDSRGRQIDTSTPFKRIISLYGAHTENLFSLGLEDKIIGVSVNDAYPDQAREKMKFSYHDDPEKFIGAMPDLVLIRPMIDNGYPKFVQQLEKYNIVVVSLQPSTLPEMYAYWLTLGQLTGTQDQAQNMVFDFQQKVAHLQALTRKIP
ncbi:MAG: ABC transporter substrate-binding protein, partial [Proteobacteria bacterium]|nr:ABC transporter substrate-binding protein [Pseudomonadota bacterium]